jgi:hypothetical protein
MALIMSGGIDRFLQASGGGEVKLYDGAAGRAAWVGAGDQEKKSGK